MAKIKFDKKIDIILWLLGTIAALLFGSTLALGIQYLDCHSDLSQRTEKYDRCQRDNIDLRTEYNNLSDNCSKLQFQYEGLERNFSELQGTYEALRAATKIEFDHELLVENVDSAEKSYIKGTIQNVGTEPMKQVKIFIATWDKNRTLINIGSNELTNLAPNEIQSWRVYVGLGYKYFDCYAIGNYK